MLTGLLAPMAMTRLKATTKATYWQVMLATIIFQEEMALTTLQQELVMTQFMACVAMTRFI